MASSHLPPCDTGLGNRAAVLPAQPRSPRPPVDDIPPTKIGRDQADRNAGHALYFLDKPQGLRRKLLEPHPKNRIHKPSIRLMSPDGGASTLRHDHWPGAL